MPKFKFSQIQEIKSKHATNTFVLKFATNDYSLDEVMSFYKNTDYFEYIEPNYIARGSGVMNTIP